MKVLFRGIVMLCVFQLSFFSLSAHSQERDSSALGNHKIFYGINVGFTVNTVELYSTLGGTAHALEEGNHTIYAPGFRMATIGEVRLGHGFSLRAMPGVTLFSSKWEPTGMMLPASLQSNSYKMESVCGELPVDVKFIAMRLGKLEPYLTAGFSYKFDFASLRSDSDNSMIQPLNSHDLNVSFGYGLDWYTRYLKVGFEFKASYGLLPPRTGGSDLTDPFYFHNGHTISIGLNFEA